MRKQSNESRERYRNIPPIRVDDVEDFRLHAAAEAENLPLATWLRNLGLKRADDLGIPSEPSASRKKATP